MASKMLVADGMLVGVPENGLYTPKWPEKSDKMLIN